MSAFLVITIQDYHVTDTKLHCTASKFSPPGEIIGRVAENCSTPQRT